jgi:hypothetical protein
LDLSSRVNGLMGMYIIFFTLLPLIDNLFTLLPYFIYIHTHTHAHLGRDQIKGVVALFLKMFFY